MFKFNFSSGNTEDNQEKCSENTNGVQVCLVNEDDCREIEILDKHYQNIEQYQENSIPVSAVHEFQLINSKHVEENILNSMEGTQYGSLKTAIKMNSDVISGVYEGN